MVDTGCSNTILDSKLVPLQYHRPIPIESQFLAEQMDGTLLKYDTELRKYKFQFYTSADTLTNSLTPSACICLRDLHLKNIVFILGLNFIFGTFHGCSFFPNGLQFAAASFLAYTSESAEKRGGSPYQSSQSHSCSCKDVDKCNCLALDQDYLEIDTIDEDLSLPNT